MPDPRSAGTELYERFVARLDHPEIVALADRWAVLTERDRHLLVLHLALVEPVILSDALTAIEVMPCLECAHGRHTGEDCLAAYRDRDDLERLCWCTADRTVLAGIAFNSHADDALALVADDTRMPERDAG